MFKSLKQPELTTFMENKSSANFDDGLPENDESSKIRILKYLTDIILGLSVFGLVVMILRGSNFNAFIVILSNIIINLFIKFLYSRRHIFISSILFCFTVNFGIAALAAINIFVEQALLTSAIFCSQLGLCIVLAGMLLDVRGAIGALVLNTAILLGLFWADTQQPQSLLLGNGLAINQIAIPIIGFFGILTVISVLYQRSLAKSALALQEAQDRSLREQVLLRELVLAQNLQTRLYPLPPERYRGLRAATRSLPALETSGDLYDFYELDDDRLGIVFSDISGKSITAAFTMAMVRTIIRAEVRRSISPREILQVANQFLCEERSISQITTALYCELNTRTKTLLLSNAGHPYPILVRDGACQDLEVPGWILGSQENSTYDEILVHLQPGDMIVMYSDGIIEERNPGGEMYGLPRLNALLPTLVNDEPDSVIEAIKSDVTMFRGRRPQSDDMTILVLKFGPEFGSSDE